METYDICITAVPTDSDTARTLADSLRRYRLPGGVTAEPGRERRSVTLLTSQAGHATMFLSSHARAFFCRAFSSMR